MRRQTKVTGLGVVIFFFGIIVIGASVWSTQGPIEYKQTLATYPTPPATGEDIPTSITIGPFEGIRGGINISGSFEGYQDHPLFRIWDLESELMYVSPSFPAPSNIIEFPMEPGYYTITFDLFFSNDSRVEVYEYREETGTIYPHKKWYNVGVFLGIAGIVTSAVGAFLPSKLARKQ